MDEALVAFHKSCNQMAQRRLSGSARLSTKLVTVIDEGNVLEVLTLGVLYT